MAGGSVVGGGDWCHCGGRLCGVGFGGTRQLPSFASTHQRLCHAPCRWGLTSEMPGATATLKLDTQLGSASDHSETVQVRASPAGQLPRGLCLQLDQLEAGAFLNGVFSNCALASSLDAGAPGTPAQLEQHGPCRGGMLVRLPLQCRPAGRALGADSHPHRPCHDAGAGVRVRGSSSLRAAGCAGRPNLLQPWHAHAAISWLACRWPGFLTCKLRHAPAL